MAAPQQGRTLRGFNALVVIVAALVSGGDAAAEFCWEYTDGELAKVPIKCVQQGNPAVNCFWQPDCNTDNDPSDCCITIPDVVPATVGQMHIDWHMCFGGTGTAASPPPPGRGQRWFAFHRQFEADFNAYRDTMGYPKIESLEWCPDMNMPYGHHGAGLMMGDHPLGCGIGINRPDNTACVNCEAFRKCLYLNGAGPAACPAPALPVCAIAGVSFPYDSLDDFQSAEEIATLLDVYFHDAMHGAVAFADGSGYNMDAASPNCSPRDPMFWRLHKALDDVIRAWQDVKAVDVSLVIDRSGSMSAASGTGAGSRLDNAVEAADMFADLLEEGRSDGLTNRIGIISYSSTAANAALNLALTDVDDMLRTPGGPFETVLSALTPAGSTSIGSGIVAAVDQLCPGGTCLNYVPAVGENERKAILLLTDGKENTAPCLKAGCEAGGGGAEIDYATLDVTQLCAVGLGNGAAINGELLTLLAERQGGIYLNNTDATGTDLKDFFAKCFGQLTDEFIGLDPKGQLGAKEAATEVIPYASCDDQRITFASGWNVADRPGDRLRLLVRAPNGDAWVPSPGYGEVSDEATWAFKRAPLPYGAQSTGTWTMQLVRPQQTFVNGFTTDSFADAAEGTALVRREIQRLCPVEDGGVGCPRVLYFEDGNKGPSAYRTALDAEIGMSINPYLAGASAADFDAQLAKPWDLIVYARQAGADVDEIYDASFAALMCEGQRAIVTDTRTRRGARKILRCAGAKPDRNIMNRLLIEGNGTLVEGTIRLRNPGHAVFSYGLRPRGGGRTRFASLEALFGDAPPTRRPPAALVGTNLRGSDLHWFANVLVRGLSKLTPVVPRSVPRTGEPLLPSVRILPSFNRAGGYPNGRMTVEVERPTVGLGALLRRTGKSKQLAEDTIDPREAKIQRKTIPTVIETYPLNDAGLDGDLHAGNAYFSAQLPISAAVDGMYTYNFMFEYPVEGCMARRELKQTLFVDVRVDSTASDVKIGRAKALPNGTGHAVTILPRDALGNVLGSGRPPQPRCSPAPCQCDPAAVEDLGNGKYRFPVVVTTPGVGISSCTVEAFGTQIFLGRGRS
jgi:von Willebrand factor type A domain/Common central domain of tyrosinase